MTQRSQWDWGYMIFRVEPAGLKLWLQSLYLWNPEAQEGERPPKSDLESRFPTPSAAHLEVPRQIPHNDMGSMRFCTRLQARRALASVSLDPDFSHEQLALKDYFKDKSIHRGGGSQSMRKLGSS